MSTYNQEIEFYNLPINVRDSFIGQQAQKILYPSGTRLVRVVSLGTNSFTGAFYISEENYAHIKKYATGRKISIQLALREALALSETFSPTLDVAVLITLGSDAYGFVGQASSQLQKKGKEYFPGGCEQIFIPNVSKTGNTKVALYERL